MLSFLSGNSFAAVGNITQASHMMYEAEVDRFGNIGILDTFFDAVRASVTEVARVAEELHLDATLSAAKQSLKFMARAVPHDDEHLYLAKNDAERLCWSLNSLVENFTAQLESRSVLVIDSHNSKFLTADDPPFGIEVDNAFPLAAEEILEAAKCLALQRNTACVFHLMRAMELAVARLAEALATGKPTDKEWGKILSDIGASIEAMPKGEKRNRWSESHSHLYHVKQAWRNDTMHPKKTYTEDQAQAVFTAVRSFMQHLAPLIR
jgi:HEPN domain-containing protein